MKYKWLIIDDCCCVDCHQSKKEMLECKRRFKKRVKERLEIPSKMGIIKTKAKVNKDGNIDLEVLED